MSKKKASINRKRLVRIVPKFWIIEASCPAEVNDVVLRVQASGYEVDGIHRTHNEFFQNYEICLKKKTRKNKSLILQ